MLNDLVNEHYDDLNENDLYIWQYICHHRETCQKSSIQQLSNMCNVSHTSIIRFIKKIGIESFSEFKVYLKWDLNNKLNFNQQVMDKLSDEMKDTLDQIKYNDLDNVMKIIDESRYIFVYPTGDLQRNVAQELKREFFHYKKVMYVIDGGKFEVDAVIKNATIEDAFIIISLSGNNEGAVNLSKKLKELNIKTIGIARGNKNLISMYVDEYINFQATEIDIGIQQNYPYTCSAHFFLIINMLFLHYLEYCSLKKK